MTAFWIIFITLMLPVEVRIIPTYTVMSNLNLINTFPGLTVPLIASATATLLFRQTFLAVPDELFEAARMDGAGPWRFLKDILLPRVGSQHRRAVRHSVRLRLEPVSLASAGGDQPEARHHRHRHRQDDRHGDGDTNGTG